jgi:hypothetical protein
MARKLLAVNLYRANGRYVKRLDFCSSKYRAKKAKEFWETKYDENTYRIEIEPPTNPKDLRGLR